MRDRFPVSSVTTRPLIRLAYAFALAIHLPARSIATSPLWLKTVACGLFLRCFAPPRRAPKGEGFKTASLHGQGAEPRGQVIWTASRRGQVGWRRYVACHFYCGGFLGAEPAQASILGYSCMVGFVSNEGDFSANARNDNEYVWLIRLIVMYQRHLRSK